VSLDDWDDDGRGYTLLATEWVKEAVIINTAFNLHSTTFTKNITCTENITVLSVDSK